MNQGHLMIRRRGVTIFESVLACILMAIAIVSATQLTIAVARHQRASLQQSVAMQEASNVLELALAESYSEGETDEPPGESPQLSSPATELLGNGSVTIEKNAAKTPETDATESPGGEWIVVTVKWESRETQQTRSVQLAGWRASKPGGIE
jgi:hypothetical protein